MITEGQQRAIRELRRLNAAAPNMFELVIEPHVVDDGWLVVIIGLRLGPIELRAGGLDLREREEFILLIPPGFPFDLPYLGVAHNRFAGFPHVIWGKTICLYQSSVEWNPSDGLFGFFDRLRLWLARAAINDMDPIEGPLEPPHHVVDGSQMPFVIRANAPCQPGESWLGLAILEKHTNRTELIGWNDLSGEWPTQKDLAFAVILPDTLPMEFPQNGKELFQEIEKAGIPREQLIRDLGLATILTPEGEPIYLVVGLPMRRAADGTQRLHIAVWLTEANRASALRHVLPAGTDTEEIRNLRADLCEALRSVFELSTIKWCRILEDRSEIVVRRDKGTPIAWFDSKKVLILGCGALGSWIAEIIARAKAFSIDLVDDKIVKPGVLARQNFEMADIGSNKAVALSNRLSSVVLGCAITSHAQEAHNFIMDDKDRFFKYDIVLDCTASSIFQMKLERDWGLFDGCTAPIVSFVIDAQANHSLAVLVPRGCPAGIWDSYLWLKHQMCISGGSPEIINAFYSERVAELMFQPEPGCSDPTFVGSTADIVGLASNALNIVSKNLVDGHLGLGLALSAPGVSEEIKLIDTFESPLFHNTMAGEYRIRISDNVLTEARRWVRYNKQIRSESHETGGLLWGMWDDSVKVIWVYDLSGPPSDSRHERGHFICGIEGTLEEHKRRFLLTHGVCGFIGYWHTHPNSPSIQSNFDITNMAQLVSTLGQNQKRALMLIFGRAQHAPMVGIYVYESQSLTNKSDLVSVGTSQIAIEELIA